MGDDRRPVHLAVLLGVSASAYAVSLAAVTSIQSTSDARLNAERAPIDAVATRMAGAHDRIEAAVRDASEAYTLLAQQYDGLVPRVTDMEVSLERLAERAAGVTDDLGSLPSRVRIPAMPRSAPGPAPAPAAKPKTNATTGASG